ncbi:MAG: hypothetical protein ABIT16_02095 [Croceibacterium sp.]
MKAHWSALAALPLALAVSQPALAADDNSCAPKDLNALKWWNGVWGAEGLEGNVAGSVSQQPKFLGTDAPWNAEGWKRMRQLAVINRANPLRIAAAWGFPMMMTSYSEVKFVIAPAETVMTSQYRDIRYIYTDGREHPSEDELWPNNWGDSIGCWEGDTLVVDTIGAKFDLDFNYLAPPLSEQAHFTERLRAVAADRIEGEITITDPVTLAAPWTVHFAFVPAGIDRLIHEGDTLLDREQLVDGKVEFGPPKGDPFETAPVPPDLMLGEAALNRLAGHYALDGQAGQVVIERRGDRLWFGTTPGPATMQPLFADEPLSFSAVNGTAFKFEADSNGQVTGFERSGLFGPPVTGKRVPG